MTVWAAAAAAYGLLLLVAAATQPIRQRSVAGALSAAYALVAIGVGSLVDAFWITLLVPGGLLLTGYWLSGFYFRDPQPWLEQWLLAVDRGVGADQWQSRLPRAVQELLELGYAADYVVVGGGAIYTATFGTEAVAYYWSLVLASELASFAPLPWLRSRPPRVIDDDLAYDHVGRRARPRPASRPPSLRRLNTAILDNASVQANTLPSGHVSGAVAAAVGVMAVDPLAGWGVMGMAGVITLAAVTGRYHYVVDCVAGAAVAAAFWSLM